MNWNTDLYDEAHSFVSRYGKDLLSLLDPRQGERIMDLGCGTGELTSLIAGSGAEVMGIDSSPEMLEAARNKYPDLRFLQIDARDLSADTPFDAVFSNAVLHWIPEKELVIRNIKECLRPGGRLVAELGGRGCVSKLLTALRSVLVSRGFQKNSQVMPWYYPSLAEYASEIEKQGFNVLYARLFDRPTFLEGEEGLKNWYCMFTGDFFQGIPEQEKESVLEELAVMLRKDHFREGGWVADYRRLRIVAVKE